MKKLVAPAIFLGFLAILSAACGEYTTWKGVFEVTKMDGTMLTCKTAQLWFPTAAGGNSYKIDKVRCYFQDGSMMEIPYGTIKEIKLSK